jgi:hypothetical protein
MTILKSRSYIATNPRFALTSAAVPKLQRGQMTKVTAVALLVVSAGRFVPRLNDALSGKAEYVRILTETFGRQLATQTQMQFPVIVEQDEHGTCQAVSAPSIAEEEIRGTIYLLTYSEQQTFTCITTYVVPKVTFQLKDIAESRLSVQRQKQEKSLKNLYNAGAS